MNNGVSHSIHIALDKVHRKERNDLCSEDVKGGEVLQSTRMDVWAAVICGASGVSDLQSRDFVFTAVMLSFFLCV